LNPQYENFINEIVWCYELGGRVSKQAYGRRHDTILFYAKSTDYIFNWDKVLVDWDEKGKAKFKYEDEKGRYRLIGRFLKDSPIKGHRDINPEWERTHPELVQRYYMKEGKAQVDFWNISPINQVSPERIGYPTQKPEELLEQVIKASSPEDGVVADFFCGGGTTPAVAQRLDRRWVACDQSRIAVSITADRVAKAVEKQIGALFPVPDFTVEHWGIYEAPKLEQYPPEKFREFVVKAFGGRPEGVSPHIHGTRYGIPLFVGEPSRRTRIGKEEVAEFAKAVYEERRANHGVMLGWNFGPNARQAAQILEARENKRIDFVRLSLVRLEDDEFREHVVNQSPDYASLLRFIQPPEVRIAARRVAPLKYEFDVSESVSLNKDGLIANVQWDFDYRDGHFTSTQGYTFLRDKRTGRPLLVVEYEFPEKGPRPVACSVQDDQGGERTVVQEVDVK